MVGQIGDFPDEMLASRFAWLTGCLNDLARFFGDLWPNLQESAAEQFRRVRLFMRLRSAGGDRAFELFEGA
jgi:hypothetical protein